MNLDKDTRKIILRISIMSTTANSKTLKKEWVRYNKFVGYKLANIIIYYEDN